MQRTLEFPIIVHEGLWCDDCKRFKDNTITLPNGDRYCADCLMEWKNVFEEHEALTKDYEKLSNEFDDVNKVYKDQADDIASLEEKLADAKEAYLKLKLVFER